MGRILGIFHHRVAIKSFGMQPWIWMDGIWAYTPLEGALQTVGLETMETYISRFQNTAAQYIVTQPILDLCLEAEQRSCSRFPM